MKKQFKRKQFHLTRETTNYAIAFALGGIVFVALTWFLGNYRLQSPVIFQSPFVSRYISPLPDSKTAKPVVLPLNGSEDKAKVEGAKASPSPTPHCKKSVYGPCLEEITPTPKKRSFIPQVEAAEIEISNDPVKEYIKHKWGDKADEALKVSFCESGTQAHNWYNKFLGATAQEAEDNGYAVGVFMIYRKVHAHHSFEDLLNYKYNIDVAYEMYKVRGWQPWLASNSCHGLL